MEFYKKNTHNEMSALKDKVDGNLSQIFFLIRNDHLIEEATQQLIANLHDWPKLLS